MWSFFLSLPLFLVVSFSIWAMDPSSIIARNNQAIRNQQRISQLEKTVNMLSEDNHWLTTILQYQGIYLYSATGWKAFTKKKSFVRVYFCGDGSDQFVVALRDQKTEFDHENIVNGQRKICVLQDTN